MIKNTFATLGVFAVLLLSFGLTSGATLAEWNLDTDGSATNVDTDVTAGDFSNNSIEITFGSDGAYADGWSIGAINTSEYFQITISPKTGYNISIDQLNFGERRSLTGIRDYQVQWSKNADFSSSTIIATVNVPDVDTERTGDITGLSINIEDGETVYIRWFGYNSEASAGTWRINDNTLSIEGTVESTTSTSDTLCELEGYNEDGDLEISDFDINVDGEGSDDEWQYLDKIEIVVEIENTDNDDDIDDVEVMIMILDDEINNGGNDVTNDFDLDDEVLTSIGKLRDGDEESVTFLIEELPSDVDDGTYYMYIMAYEDGNEDEQCVSESSKLDDDLYFKFTVESVDYDESVVARGSELALQIDTYCDQQNLEIQIPVYNLGSDEEEKVLVNIYNSELGINEYIVIDDLDNGDKEVVTFFVDIPSQLTKEKYSLDISVYFDWDSDEDDDEVLSYDEETSATIRLNILGCKAPSPTITANLGSTAEVGKELIIKATITNNGQLNDFIIAPTGFETWADLVSVEPGTLSIASGNSQEVIITLLPKQSGAQTFKIETIVDGESYIQPVSVNVKGKPGIFDGLGLSDTMLYLIIGITALLILIFLVLIIKIVRKPSKREF
jgi:hypothetical protein